MKIFLTFGFSASGGTSQVPIRYSAFKMSKYFIILIIISLLLSCNSDKCNFEGVEIIKKLNDSIISNIINDPFKRYDTFNINFNEPLLYNYKFEAYRFMIQQTGAGYTKIIRIEKEGKSITLFVKEFIESQSDQKNDSLIRLSQSSINPRDWNKFKCTLTANCFWVIPMTDKNSCRFFDPTIYSFQGIIPSTIFRNKKFHGFSRISLDSTEIINIKEAFVQFDSIYKIEQ